MTDEPVALICFNEARIKRLTIDRPLSKDEIKNGRIRLGADMFRDYDPEKHEFEIIRKEKQ